MPDPRELVRQYMLDERESDGYGLSRFDIRGGSISHEYSLEESGSA